MSLLLKSTVSTEANPAHAVLCSDNQTFQLRQVHSSNSVILLQPSCVATDTKELSSSEGLTSIAECEATLEAIPQLAPCIHQLKAALPVLTSLESENMSALTDARGRRAILEDFPVSLREFDQAWNDICALEVDGRAFRPSSAVLWKVWRSVIAACTLKGLSLEQALDFSSLAPMVEEDDVPPFILKAVVERLRAEGEVPFRECKSIQSPQETILFTEAC